MDHAVARRNAAGGRLASGEQDVGDEISFLLIHQDFAGRFFPGTSVLHTRVPYLTRFLCRGCSFMESEDVQPFYRFSAARRVQMEFLLLNTTSRNTSN